MQFEAKTIKLKNGLTAVLKCPKKEDAKQMLDYIKQACGETDFLARYPEEWDGVTEESEKQWIESRVASPNSLLLACYVNGRVIGNCEITRMSGKKVRHRATVAIAILREFWGLGIGKTMFEAMLEAAKEWAVDIVELELVEGNDRARSLYEGLGFSVVAQRPGAFRSKDKGLLGEIFMQKRLR